MTDTSSTALDGLLGSSGDAVLQLRTADVGRRREEVRRARWRLLLDWTALLAGAAVLRLLLKGDAPFLPLPHVDPFLLTMVAFFGLLAALAVGQTVLTGRSPHVVYRGDQLGTRLATSPWQNWTPLPCTAQVTPVPCPVKTCGTVAAPADAGSRTAHVAAAQSEQPTHFSRPFSCRCSRCRPRKRGYTGRLYSGYCCVMGLRKICRKVTAKPLRLSSGCGI